MKHLNRFNENKNELDTQYIDDCFVEFKDKGYSFKMEYSKYSMIINVSRGYSSRNTDSLLAFINEMRTNVDEVKYCIEKVKLKYPNINYDVFLCADGDDEIPVVNVYFNK